MGLIQELESTKAETLKFFELTDEELDKSYEPGKWTVRYILHHLADAETVLFERIRRVISEPRQVLWALDQDAWAQIAGLCQHTFRAIKADLRIRAGGDNSRCSLAL